MLFASIHKTDTETITPAIVGCANGAFSEDALNANKMNAYPVGKVPLMNDTVYNGEPQSSHPSWWSLSVDPKGMDSSAERKRLLEEHNEAGGYVKRNRDSS